MKDLRLWPLRWVKEAQMGSLVKVLLALVLPPLLAFFVLWEMPAGEARAFGWVGWLLFGIWLCVSLIPRDWEY